MTSITGQLFPQKKKHQIRQRKNWIQNVIFSQRVHLILCGYIEWRWRCTTIYIDVGSVCDTILHGGKLENIYYPNTKRRHRTHYRYSVFQFSFYRYGVSRSQTVLYIVRRCGCLRFWRWEYYWWRPASEIILKHKIFK